MWRAAYRFSAACRVLLASLTCLYYQGLNSFCNGSHLNSQLDSVGGKLGFFQANILNGLFVKDSNSPKLIKLLAPRSSTHSQLRDFQQPGPTLMYWFHWKRQPCQSQDFYLAYFLSWIKVKRPVRYPRPVFDHLNVYARYLTGKNVSSFLLDAIAMDSLECEIRHENSPTRKSAGGIPKVKDLLKKIVVCLEHNACWFKLKCITGTDSNSWQTFS